ERLRAGARPSEIAILTPRKDIGGEFAIAANRRLVELAMQEQVNVDLVSRGDLSTAEQKSLLKLGLLAKPNSILRPRVLVGLEDGQHFAEEFNQLRQQYGNLENALRQ